MMQLFSVIHKTIQKKLPECANPFFSNIVRLFGLPKIVLHDHDSRFSYNFCKAFWEFLGPKVLFTSVYHPYTDG